MFYSGRVPSSQNNEDCARNKLFIKFEETIFTRKTYKGMSVHKIIKIIIILLLLLLLLFLTIFITMIIMITIIIAMITITKTITTTTTTKAIIIIIISNHFTYAFTRHTKIIG